jgi:hypothetical protein
LLNGLNPFTNPFNSAPGTEIICDEVFAIILTAEAAGWERRMSATLKQACGRELVHPPFQERLSVRAAAFAIGTMSLACWLSVGALAWWLMF